MIVVNPRESNRLTSFYRFVAKPIGRLGGPGLIPVSFVEIRDPLTSRPIENVEELLHQGTVPHLDTWKQEAHEYKASAIPLGSFQDLNEARETSRGAPDRQQSGDDGASKTDIFLRDGDVISTHVKSFHYEAEAYWFRINAIFLPDDPDAQAISLVLYRLYEDFYNFQITLLDLFPREAGRGENHRESSNSTATQVSRILPYMPGPLEQVDVDITNTRREDLDTYLRELLDLRNLGAGYILRDDHVLGFFSPGPGDMMENVTRQQAEMMATEVAESQARLGSPGANGTNESGTHENGLEDRLAEMNMGNRYSASTGRGSPMSPSEQAFFGGGGNGNDRTSLNGGTSSNSLGHSRASLNDAGVRGSPASSNNGLPQARGGPSPFSPAVPTGSTTSFGSGSRASGHTVPMPVGSTPPPGQPNGLPVTSATTNGSLVPGGNPAFIKIKILDRNTDDMIAIRVPPRVTYDQLVEKVRDRLVAQVSRLQYRTTGGAEAFRDVTDDRSLMEWLEKEDKLVLYAE
jgi:bud emergence protein 1